LNPLRALDRFQLYAATYERTPTVVALPQCRQARHPSAGFQASFVATIVAHTGRRHLYLLRQTSEVERMRIDERLVPVLINFWDEPAPESQSDVVSERAEEAAQAQSIVDVLARRVPDSVTWADRVTGGAHPVPVRIYTPEPADKKLGRPALLYAHGGAWRTGSVATAHEKAGNLTADAEVIVVSVDYRLIPEHPYPAGLDDLVEALRWTVHNAAALGIDPERIAVGGVSAGGNLAAALALKSRDRGGPTIALQLLEAPALDLTPDSPSWDECRRDMPPLATVIERGLRRYVEAGADPDDPYCAPLAAPSHEGLPRAVVLVSEADPLRSDSVRYADALGAAGIRVALHVFPGIVHGTENFVLLMPAAEDWFRTCVAALRSLQPARPDAVGAADE
jgi:acetyl esterase